MNERAHKLYDQYLEAWKPIPDARRRQILAEIIDERVQYSTPNRAGGVEAMIEDMTEFQKKFPGGHFALGGVSAHHEVALLTWILVQADGHRLAQGQDLIRISEEGKIAALITFAPQVLPGNSAT